MDNASKALIMAGAILIAVALVGVGVYLYQSATGTVSTGVDQLNAASMETKNSMIEQYEGKIKGSDLKQLVRKVNTYNENDVFPADLKWVNSVTGTTGKPTGLNTAGTAASTTAGIQNSKIYTISLTYTQGWITTITVK